MNKIWLKPHKEAAIQRFHPWVFSGAIQRIEGDPADGDEVQVLDHKGQFLALGHYQAGSITVRLLAYEPTPTDAAFWTHKLRRAFHYRQQLGFHNSTHTNCYRLVHAEGDGLPGLIIDIYNRTAVIQCHSIGMHKARMLITQALLELYGGHLEAVYDKSAETLPDRYAATVNNAYLHGMSTQRVALENDHSFLVDWEGGQKTGFFLDQRDNRSLCAKYAKGKTVLNAFCYSGGFSIYALQAGAVHVDSVDVSKKAIELVEQNVALNVTQQERHRAYASDVLPFLKNAPGEYDLMIVDPPAFAKHFDKRHNAVQGYKRLNALAMQKIKPGGILFTFSCSQVVDEPLFYNTIVAAALESGRQARVMHRLSQPPDHPVNCFHPEGAYLKGLVLYVE